MTFYIIRHADKESGDFYNPRLRHQDQPISEKGRCDAFKLCAFFGDKAIAAIYVSGYQRTRQTIEKVAEQLLVVPIIDERLNEIDNGALDGLTDQEIEQRFPETWQAFIERNRDFRFPDGETGVQAQQRVVEFFEEKRHQHANENVIVVTHDGLIRLLMCYVVGIPVWKRWNFRVDTCGIMEISYEPRFESWKLIRFNQALQNETIGRVQ